MFRCCGTFPTRPEDRHLARFDFPARLQLGFLWLPERMRGEEAPIMKFLWRCPLMMDSLKNRSTPCSSLVRSQFEQAGLRAKSEFHLPEPWSGVESSEIPGAEAGGGIPLMFLVLDAPFRKEERNIPTFSHDLDSYRSYYTRRFADRLGVFRIPDAGESLLSFGNVSIERRNGGCPGDFLSYLESPGASPGRGVLNLLWTRMASAAAHILDARTLRRMGYSDSFGILGKHCIVMPLVHCKSVHGTGVEEAAAACMERHTRRLIEKFRARLTIIVGADAREILNAAGWLVEADPASGAAETDSKFPPVSLVLPSGHRGRAVYVTGPGAEHGAEASDDLCGLISSPSALESMRESLCGGTPR